MIQSILAGMFRQALSDAIILVFAIFGLFSAILWVLKGGSALLQWRRTVRAERWVAEHPGNWPPAP